MMKHLLLLLPLSAAVILSGCMSTTTNSTTNTLSTGATHVVVTGKHDRPDRDYTVNLSDKDPSLSFQLLTGDVITLAVQSPTPKTVVRVNQVFSPDGKADGPFSSTTVYTATQAGLYEFTIGVNQMASEDIYTGNVVVHFSLVEHK